VCGCERGRDTLNASGAGRVVIRKIRIGLMVQLGDPDRVLYEGSVLTRNIAFMSSWTCAISPQVPELAARGWISYCPNCKPKRRHSRGARHGRLSSKAVADRLHEMGARVVRDRRWEKGRASFIMTGNHWVPAITFEAVGTTGPGGAFAGALPMLGQTDDLLRRAYDFSRQPHGAIADHRPGQTHQGFTYEESLNCGKTKT